MTENWIYIRFQKFTKTFQTIYDKFFICFRLDPPVHATVQIVSSRNGNGCEWFTELLNTLREKSVSVLLSLWVLVGNESVTLKEHRFSKWVNWTHPVGQWDDKTESL